MTTPIIVRLAVSLAFAAVAVSLAAQRLRYPEARKVDHVDTYFGVKVADPYRWLEDDNSADTREVGRGGEQGHVRVSRRDSVPAAQLKARLNTLYNYPRYTAPSRKGRTYFFTKNDGLQNQSVLYIQKGLDGTPEVLIDPNTWSADGTDAARGLGVVEGRRSTPSTACRSGGSDWHELQRHGARDAGRRCRRTRWVKVSSVAWQGRRLLLQPLSDAREGQGADVVNEDHQVYFHRVGTPQSADELVFEDTANPQRFHTVQTTEDERFAVLDVSDRGKGKDGNALFCPRPVEAAARDFTPIIAEITNDTYDVVDNVGDKLLVETDTERAELDGRADRSEANRRGATGRRSLPEKPEPLESVSTAGGKLFVTYLKDVTTRAYVYSLDGTLENEIELPGLGIAGGFGGNHDDTFVFYTFTSFT